MLKLYQFPISHYCEKARWALDYKGLEYELINLLPGEHINIIKSMAAKTEVPVLQHPKGVVQGSCDIISYLDRTFPENPLTPLDNTHKQQVLEWEAFVDTQIGPHTRLYFYHYLLDKPNILIPLLAQGQPWHKRWIFRLVFPKVRKRIRHYMRVNDETAAISLQTLTHAIDKVSTQLETTPFLASDHFTRADLSAAALLAPFRTPEKYGLTWPKKLPGTLQQTIDSFKPQLIWVDSLYKNYR